MKKIHENLEIYEKLNLLDLNKYDTLSVKESLSNQYNSWAEKTSESYNFPIKLEHPLIIDLVKEFTKTLGGMGKKIKKIEELYLMSNNEDYCPINWHNHIQSADIVGVYYLSVPKSMKGGNISFKDGKDNLDMRPKENSLLIFPNWLLHTTNYIEGKNYRISINMEAMYE